MTEFSDALGIASSGMNAQASRMRYVSENIANSDTPGYRRKMVEFEGDFATGGQTGRVELGPVMLDRSELGLIYDPSHILSDDTGHYEGSNVDLLVEIADAREASRSYEANLKVFDQVRQMSTSLMELLRR
ncbi:flagellar basal body rod protein FlgC [Ponticoccus sp. SC2-23]|uniref:flagellar basal body rod protein FlgC n=1 Tax=Alexandriicola marinus TaxID=2081710 RepID=UPI000FD85587|nr:flagellar basal body rod protein FlgC [Alexandriicola marinus]MBM1220508.1 flagellar basal body rod protein FlgC [Ponticoccus sp. SC6-9]MBM1225194.1 flagellar basal body rod protein FlgC [Ponticoccus sp. SC6-15]MBM1228708.1 flagellar basal body rod protein FlgC [Ponticoccus sp. SC6-38]MBM1233655.1 flagellar basal body rod protein FlgC [Ponticoccus sp. SC6-45]MBM1239209.1 flagellar basal body rod protein FlgC [Ponticoccus sp. SC6-49]MBM1242991.1 flagellar basal body rod protein FlgC [Pontic